MKVMFLPMLFAVIVATLYLIWKGIRGKIGEEQFMEIVRRRIARDYPDQKIVGGEGLTLVLEKGDEAVTVFMDNAYSRCRNEGIPVGLVIDQYLGGVISTPMQEDMSWDHVKEQLLPVPKPDEYFDGLRSMPDGEKILSNHLVFKWRSKLRVLVAIDSERSMSFVTRDQLEQWGVCADDVIKTAYRNLAANAVPLWRTVKENDGKSRVMHFAYGDCYDAARMMLPNFYEVMSKAAGRERIAVIIPTRDSLTVFPLEAGQSTDKIAKIAADAFTVGPYPVSREVFVFPDDFSSDQEVEAIQTAEA